MVGSHMVEHFYNVGEEVVGTYYKPTTDIGELPSGIPMIECDVRYPENIERVILDFKPEQI